MFGGKGTITGHNHTISQQRHILEVEVAKNVSSKTKPNPIYILNTTLQQMSSSSSKTSD